MRIETYPNEATVVPLMLNHTTTPDADARWLLWMAERHPGDVLEIGTHEGQMTREFAMVYPKRHVWTVDWPDNPEIQPWQRQEVLPASQIGHLSRYMPNVSLLLVNSHELDYDQLSGLSMVYIDGDHSYEGVKADTEKAIQYFATSPKAVKPGLIVWHDYGVEICGVTKYLDSRSDLDLIRVEGKTLVYTEIE